MSDREQHPRKWPDRPPSGGFKWAFHIYTSIVSPAIHTVSPSRCVYLPTCSEYAYVAMQRFGILRGGWMALKRLARCHPLAKGGFDPVPQRTPGGVASAPSAASRFPIDRLP